MSTETDTYKDAGGVDRWAGRPHLLCRGSRCNVVFEQSAAAKHFRAILSLTCACLLASARPCRLRTPASSSPTLNCENFCFIPSWCLYLISDPLPSVPRPKMSSEVNTPMGVGSSRDQNAFNISTNLPTAVGCLLSSLLLLLSLV